MWNHQDFDSNILTSFSFLPATDETTACRSPARYCSPRALKPCLHPGAAFDADVCNLMTLVRRCVSLGWDRVSDVSSSSRTASSYRCGVSDLHTHVKVLSSQLWSFTQWLGSDCKTAHTTWIQRKKKKLKSFSVGVDAHLRGTKNYFLHFTSVSCWVQTGWFFRPHKQKPQLLGFTSVHSSIQL